MKTQTKRPQSRGDKLLILVTAALIALALGGFFWLRALDKAPVVRLPPPTVMPAVNARDYFLKAASAAKQTGSVAPSSEARRLLHQGFLYPYQWPSQAPPSVPLLLNQQPPQTASDSSLAFLTRQISTQAQAEAQPGHWAAAADAGLDLVQFGVAVMHGADYNGTFNSHHTQRLGYNYLRAALSHLDAAQARTAARRLETIRRDRTPFADTVTQEKWEKQAMLLDVLRHSQWRGRWGWTNKSMLPDPKAWAQDVAAIARQRTMSKRQIFADHQRYYAQVLAAVQHPYAEKPPALSLPKAWVDQVVIGDDYTMVWTMTVEADTENSLLMTQLALRSYKLDHGAYPKTLLALVPGYLKAVPTDPFALSGPLKYKLAGAKYVLYSMGPDGRDDGGKAILDATTAAPPRRSKNDPRRWVQEDSTGDVVAGVNIF